MNRLVPAITKEEIATHISRVAREITNDCQGSNVVFIGVLNGAFIFLSDLLRQIDIEEVEVDFLQISSYGSGMVSTGNILLKKDIDVDTRNKNIVLVEDIVDTGLTLSFLIDHLKLTYPKSIKICTLIDKKERRKVDLNVDYACCVMDRGFLVGYGLDYAGKYRNLPEIYCIEG